MYLRCSSGRTVLAVKARGWPRSSRIGMTSLSAKKSMPSLRINPASCASCRDFFLALRYSAKPLPAGAYPSLKRRAVSSLALLASRRRPPFSPAGGRPPEHLLELGGGLQQAGGGRAGGGRL